MTNRLDILILGATGYTGMHCIPYMHRMAEGRKLTWGIAGRNQAKLKEVLDIMSKKVGADLSNIPIVLCDIKSDESLLKMAKQAKIVINCCGPYKFLGEPVIKACIEAGTHQVDVTGEPQYMDSCYVKYDKLAKDKGVYIISACGIDCIPIDLGVVYLQKNFGGTLNSVVTYLEVGLGKSDKQLTGSAVNYGTWESLIESISSFREIAELMRKTNSNTTLNLKPKLKTSLLPQIPKVVEGWALPFPSADKSVVQRTQQYFYDTLSWRPVQIDTKFVIPSFLYLILFLFGGLVIGLMACFRLTKNLLLRYPEWFSLGMFSKNPPSEEMTENYWFRVTCYGEGWKLENGNDQYTNKCDKAVISRVKGKNPGYGTTCACVVGAAVVIATEADKISLKGGVLTPGMAFANTSLINILQENKITFEIISEKYL